MTRLGQIKWYREVTSKLLRTWPLARNTISYNDPVRHIPYNHWNKMCGLFWYFVFYFFPSYFINKTCWSRSFKLILWSIYRFWPIVWKPLLWDTSAMGTLLFKFTLRSLVNKYPKPRVLLSEFQSCFLFADPFVPLRNVPANREGVRRDWCLGPLHSTPNWIHLDASNSQAWRTTSMCYFGSLKKG